MTPDEKKLLEELLAKVRRPCCGNPFVYWVPPDIYICCKCGEYIQITEDGVILPGDDVLATMTEKRKELLRTAAEAIKKVKGRHADE